MLRLYIILVGFLYLSSAHAVGRQGFDIYLGFFPTARLIKKTAEIDQTAYTSDLMLGYTNTNSTTYGVVYSVQHEEYKQVGFSNPSDNQNIVRDRGSVGVLVGHEFDSFYVHLIFYASSTWTDNFNTVLTTYKKGYGGQFDIGIPIAIGTSLYFAPQLSIQTFQYLSSESGGNTSDLNPPMTDTVISPYLVLGFMI